MVVFHKVGCTVLYLFKMFKLGSGVWIIIILEDTHHAVVGDAWVAVAPEDERHGRDEVDEDASSKTTVHFRCVCAQTTSVLKLPHHHEVASHPQGTAKDGEDDVLQTHLLVSLVHPSSVLILGLTQ